MTNQENIFDESDWKLFSKKIKVWQEAYALKLCAKYRKILCQEQSALDSFWEIEESIGHDKKCKLFTPEMRRSALLSNILPFH